MYTCRICGASNPAHLFLAPEMMRGCGETFEYFQCPTCDCLQIVDIPHDLQHYYQGDYYSFDLPPMPTGLVAKMTRARNAYAVTNRGLLGRLLYAALPRIDLRFLSRISLQRDMRVLDVGCGAGKLLRLLSDIGMTQLCGIDPFIVANSKPAPGVHLRKVTLADFDEPQDLVMFNHAFEHLPDQHATMRKAASLIDDQGAVTISIPLSSSLAWEKYRTDWVQLDAPRHLYLHSRRSIALVAERAGLSIVDVFYDSSAFQYWGSEQYRKGIPLMAKDSYAIDRGASMFSKAEISRFEKDARTLNKQHKGDQATFILRRA